ncbi:MULTISPECIES: anti-sigma factor [unclassified Arthrobacter]|uniref:anti-sigma factor family protein n=1 Tax=unclassified Arthrobacter TaxID=235627 RepID=UPI0021050A1A|nr:MULTISPECIES: zf-HC2 domain-containing protein [unclassified Arthrobacter]MCQ1945474.1 zf-HC2 domain-containing protein [Arthrobacter sp. zg-Y1116]MCQ1985421.1 zf-HC2 domain-containing protein [Arthrobacter sp. zg-Y844]MCQ1994865.1 zf-HC2 domain-containing protein [Arthrobacter sp. zg-Y1171]UWX81070.1 zf-HC2 domain-containing protein [Arthrobacter sp. zg-Y1171]
MRHPKRHLRNYIDGETTPQREQAIDAHLSRCASCRAVVAEERRLRSRLRSFRVPDAGPELSARIAGRVTALQSGCPESEAGQPGAPAKALDRRSHAVAAVGAVAAAGAVLLGGAYFAGSILEVPAQAGARAAMAAGWEEVAQSGNLEAEQLQLLRAHGWTCPELADLGLKLESARSLRVQGRPAVEMTFAADGEQLRLVEQHPLPGEDRQPVINAMTGRPVSEDGFSVAGSQAGPAVFGSAEHPGQKVVAAGSVTYTFESSQPEKSLPRAVEELSLLESARLARTGDDAEPMERIVRGLSMFTRTGWSL